MFKTLRNFWNKNGWFIIFLICIIALVVLYIYKEESNISSINTTVPLTEFTIGENGERKSLQQTINAIMPKFHYERKRQIVRESKGERATKQALLRIYGVPFTKIRPFFLKNEETGRNLEIDAYNDKLKIGVEYNGRQHYIYTPGLHNSYFDFAKTQERDELKRKKCIKNGITLIEIPYNVRENEIEKYLRYKLRALGKL